jgi:hypothetical protein
VENLHGFGKNGGLALDVLCFSDDDGDVAAAELAKCSSLLHSHFKTGQTNINLPCNKRIISLMCPFIMVTMKLEWPQTEANLWISFIQLPRLIYKF